MLILRCRCPNPRRQHHFSPASASSCSAPAPAPPGGLLQAPPRWLRAVDSGGGGGGARAGSLSCTSRAAAAAAGARGSRVALPRRRLWPRRLTTPGSQSPPRPARREETNQSGRPKVCLRLCSAGLFPGEDAAGVWDCWEGEAGPGLRVGGSGPRAEDARKKPGPQIRAGGAFCSLRESVLA